MKAIRIRITDLLEEHGDTFQKCKGCATCEEIKTLRKQLERDPAEKFKHILAKGQDMTRSEIGMLLESGINQLDIITALRMSKHKFSQLIKNWKLQYSKGDNEMAFDFNVNEYYQKHIVEKRSLKDIAQEKGVHINKIYAWKQANKKKIKAAIEGIETVNKLSEKQAVKNKYAEYVTMFTEEYEKLLQAHGESLTKKMIDTLNNYKGASGKKYKSDYLAILNWVVEKVLNQEKMVVAKEDKTAEYESLIDELKKTIRLREISIEERDNFISELETKVAEYENISAACEDVENEIASLREELSKETREKKYAQAEYEKALDKLEEVAYKLNNQRNVIDLNIKKNERYEKENKAMRELLALWI